MCKVFDTLAFQNDPLKDLFHQRHLQNYTKVPTEAILRRKMHCSELIYSFSLFLRVFVPKKIFENFSIIIIIN